MSIAPFDEAHLEALEKLLGIPATDSPVPGEDRAQPSPPVARPASKGSRRA